MTMPDMTEVVPANRENLSEVEGWAQNALNKLRRAEKRGTGYHLSADEIFALGLTRFGELWAEPDPRSN
jgi:hypothetical protein